MRLRQKVPHRRHGMGSFGRLGKKAALVADLRAWDSVVGTVFFACGGRLLLIPSIQNGIDSSVANYCTPVLNDVYTVLAGSTGIHLENESKA